jgi:sugar phosphate permease
MEPGSVRKEAMGRGGKRWAIFAILSSMFVLSMFYRVSNAVIARELVRDLGLSAEGLGLLGGAFFYSFALLQVPMGAAIDRIGPRIIVAVLPLVTALGAFLFALSESFTLAFIARLLIGMGMACVLMGTFKVFTAWFSPDEFGTMIGLTHSVGTLGNILATSPLAYLTILLGWRTSFVIIGIVTILTCAIVFKVVRDRPGGPKGERVTENVTDKEEHIPIPLSLRMIFGKLAFWQISTAVFFRHGTSGAIRGLWGGPYLMDVLGYSPIRAGNILMMMSLGAIIGGPLGGKLSDRVFRSRKKVVIGGMSAYAMGIFFLTGWARITHEVFYYGLFFCLGFFMSFGIVIFSHIKELFDIRMAATAMTAVNFFAMMGAAVFMQAMGKVIEIFPKVGGVYPPSAYHTAFTLCLLGIAIAIAFYGFSKDTKPNGASRIEIGESSPRRVIGPRER